MLLRGILFAVNTEVMKSGKNSDHTRKKKNGNKKVILVGIIASIIAIMVVVLLPSGIFHNPSTGIRGIGKENDQTSKAYMISQISDPSFVNAPALGSNKAKVTMVEFGDYRCHFCARFHKYTSGGLIQNFVDTGQVRFLFKDFIVNDKPGDTTSMLAAIASYCAADQGKYWPYHNEVYNNSKGEDVAWVNPSILKQFAMDVKIPNINKFSNCLDSHTHANIVEQNNELAGNIGLQATPSFILISTSKAQAEPFLVQGAQPYSVFQQVIEKLESSA